MNYLYKIWTQDLDKAIAQAKALGRYEIADYLTLKSSNDSIRKEGVKWVFDSILEIVFAFNRHDAKIKIEQKEKHRFNFKNRSLSGSFLKLKRGVRELTFEAGWTKSASDSIMPGGALVCAKISHFGFKKNNEELVLLKFEDKPQWFSIVDENHRISFNTKSFQKHFKVFLG